MSAGWLTLIAVIVWVFLGLWGALYILLSKKENVNLGMLFMGLVIGCFGGPVYLAIVFQDVVIIRFNHDKK